MRPTNLGSSDFKIEINIASQRHHPPSSRIHGFSRDKYDNNTIDFIPFFSSSSSSSRYHVPIVPRPSSVSPVEEEIGLIFRENDARKNMQAGTMPSESVSWTVHEIRSRGLYSAAGCSRCWIAVTGIDSSAPSCARRCLPLYNEL